MASSVLYTLLISSACSIICYARQDSPVDQCPPWFFYNTTKICECYSNPSTDHIVRCTEKEALLKLGYCMTYQEDSGFHVGICKNVKLIVLKQSQITISGFPTMFLTLMITCVDQQTDKIQCVVGVQMALVLQSSLLDIHVPTALVYGMECLSIYSWSLYHFKLLSSILLSYFRISMSPQLLWWPLSFSVRQLFHHSLPWLATS